MTDETLVLRASFDSPQTPLDSAAVARGLIARLLRDGYLPGDRLPSERWLALELGVGRSVVREALRSLSLLGIVELRRGDGTYLTRSTEDSVPRAAELGMLLGSTRIRDLSIVESRLEVVTAGLAAQRRSEAALSALDVIQDRLVHADHDPTVLMQLNHAFHHSVWAAASNHVLAQTLASICALLDFHLGGAIQTERDHVWIIDDHARILEAIRYRDQLRARAAMEEHMAAVFGRPAAHSRTNDPEPATPPG